MTEKEHPENTESGPDGSAVAADLKVDPVPKRRPIDWARISNLMSAVRSGIVNVAMLLSALALIGLTALELFQRPVVIDPIRLAGKLGDMGYSEDIAALRLADAIEQIKNVAPTSKQGVDLLAASLLPDFEPADAGFSLQNVVQFLRQILKLPETRIGGEFICTMPDCAQEGLVLRLRVLRPEGVKIIELPPAGAGGAPELDRYFKDAALKMLRELDPYLVAAYLYDPENPDAAEREALRILGPTNPQRKWAMNLLGLIAADRKEYDTAIAWYKRAIAADKNFAFPHTNWGTALLAKGEVDFAIAKHRSAIRVDRKYAFAYLNLADALAAKVERDGKNATEEDRTAALAYIERAARIDPESAYAYLKWGEALDKDKDWDGAIEKFRRATEIEPSNAVAYLNWGIALVKKENYPEAIKKYARAAEFASENANVSLQSGIALEWGIAYYNWGIALKKNRELGDAKKKFARAAGLRPEDAHVFFQWGVVLGEQGDHPGAAEKLARATSLNPGYAQAQYFLGMELVQLKNYGSAVIALECYVKLDRTAAEAKNIPVLIKSLRRRIPGELPAAGRPRGGSDEFSAGIRTARQDC